MSPTVNPIMYPGVVTLHLQFQLLPYSASGPEPSVMLPKRAVYVKQFPHPTHGDWYPTGVGAGVGGGVGAGVGTGVGGGVGGVAGAQLPVKPAAVPDPSDVNSSSANAEI